MMSKQNDFDRIFREKLTEVAPPFQVDSWDLFEQRLDAEEAGMPIVEASSIDAVAFDKLHEIEVPYQPEHWQVMANKLNAGMHVRRKIASYKLLELTVMLLILLVLGQLVPVQEGVDDHHLAPTVQVEETDPQAHLVPTKTAGQELTSETSTSGLAESATSKITQSAADPKLTESVTPTLKETKVASSATTAKKTRVVFQGLSPLNLTPVSRLVPETSGAQQAFRFKTNLEQQIQIEQEKTSIAVLAAVAVLPLEQLPITRPYELGLQAQLPKRTVGLRIGMQGGGGYDRIITPPTTINGEEVSADRLALGYIGGLSLGVERGRWEVETGFLYESKSYDPPKPVVYVGGSIREGLDVKGVRRYGIDILNIPLWIKYNFISRDRWRVYALGGASGHFVMQSNYFLGDEDSFQTANFRPPANDRSGGRSTDLDDKLAEENRQLTRGILDGGKIRQNTFFSLNLGVGVERYMTYRWSVFTQPVYQHSFLNLNGGLGPYKDRIHNLSLLMGIKVKL